MKKIFSFTKKKKYPSGTPDNGSVLSVGYDLKEKDLGKVHKAAWQGDLAKLKQAAKKNDINQLDKENRTALHIACASGHVDVVQFLVESKAKLNLCDNQNRSALMKAVQGQHERCVSTLLENHAEPNLVDINGNTALHLASNIPSISTAVLLLEHEADINAQNKEGFTPLTVAVREDHIEMAEFLLKEGAEVNFLDQDQRSPLMLAAGNGQIGMLRLLLRFDADITLKDAKGWSADDYAVMNGHHPCSLLIIEHGTQRNDGPSLPQGPSKKKKKNPSASPSQDLEAGFSLGGPATDKDDFEDNSQSESLSRVSKSAADEWPSSEDDDESVLVEKKPQKVNLRKMIESKKGEASAQPDKSSSGTESEPESDNRVQSIPSLPKAVSPIRTLQYPLDPSPASFLLKAPQMSSTPLPIYKKQAERPSGSKAKSRLHEGSPEDSEEEDEDEDDDDDDDDEDDEEDDEDEEEDDDDDEEDDDEESEDDEEEEEEEEEEGNEYEDQEGDSSASVDAKAAQFQDVQKPSIAAALEIIDTAGDQEADAPSDDVIRTPSFAVPGTLGVEVDCVVSAIRVESKFSDEDDSLGRECVLLSDKNVIPDSGGAPTLSGDHRETHSASELKEGEREKQDEHDDSLSSKHNSANSEWNDSDDSEEKQTGRLALSKALLDRKKIAAKCEGKEDLDCPSDNEDDGSTKQDMLKKRKSSWGSSLDENDSDNSDLPKEDEDNAEALDPKNTVQESDTLPEAPPADLGGALTQQEQPESSWDSSSLSPKHTVTPRKTKKSPFGSPAVTPQPERGAAVEESEWDSASEKHAATSPAPATTVMDAQAEEEQCSDGPDKDSVRESNDPSPAVSPVSNDVNTAGNQGDAVEPTEAKSDSDNQKSDDSSWDDHDDDDDESEGSEKLAKAFEDDNSDEEAPQGAADGDYACPKEESALVAGEGKDDEPSDDSDSKDHKLQYDFASATVKASDDDSEGTLDGCLAEGDRFDNEDEARLTAYTSLQDQSTSALSVAVAEPDEDPALEGAQTKDNDQLHDPDGDSDNALPQTDIDDVDLDSPDEAESLGVRLPEIRNSQERPIKKEDSTEGDDSDKDEDNEEDMSDEQPEEMVASFGATSDVPKRDLSKDQKRDFLSELGLERGEEDEDSYDSECQSDNIPRNDDQGLEPQDQEEATKIEAAAVEEEEGTQSPAAVADSNGGEVARKDKSASKEAEKAKWEPLLSKLDGGNNQKTDLMDELSLGDCDDLEDASDWDSASITSKRTLPGHITASPGLEELPECSNPPVEEKEVEEEEEEERQEDISPKPQSRVSIDKKQLSTSPLPAPRPLPRMRKTVLPESEESDWDQDNSTSSCNSGKSDNHPQHEAEPRALAKPGSTELPTMAQGRESNVRADEPQENERDDAVESGEVDLNVSGRAAHDELGDERSPEERGEKSDSVPWEQRYEKLWVEVEKREVKSNFRNVAVELKEKFGKLFKLRQTAEDASEEEEATAESSSAEEESSEEEEGEVIVRPTARARSTVLRTISEQTESGLEDSASESADREKQGVAFRGDPLADDITGCYRPPLPALQITNNGDSIEPTANDGTVPISDIDSLFEDDTRYGPSQEKPLSETFIFPDEVAKTDIGSKKDPREPLGSRQARRAESTEELVDTDRVKLEVGKEAGKNAPSVRESGDSWDAGGTESVGVGAEKPETRLGCREELSSPAGAAQQEQKPTATDSRGSSKALQRQPHTSPKQEGLAIEETLQPGRARAAPQIHTHVNGDLSVFDDSSLSDVSDDEGRMHTREHRNSENPEEMEMAEDFDELTQSSDTATEEIDSPTSGYRHASLLIQKLDSATFDSRSMVKLQNIFHEYERSIQKARSRHGYLADKVSQLELERTDLKSSLEAVKDVKSSLERNQLELQTEVTNLKFQLKQEQENGRNATMMYNTTKDKLRRTEEQQQLEVQERQKVELALRNLELEMRTLVNNMKQLEEDHCETQRLLAQERSARTLQENLLNSHLRKQQEIEAENRRNLSKSNEALSQLTEASDREKELLQQTSSLQEQLSILRTDFEHAQANSNLRERHLSEENETLKEQLEDARRDLKLNGDALTQTVFTCNNQMAALKSELTITTTRLENERQARETLSAEVESARSRMAGAVQEAERCLGARTDAEKALLWEKEEHQRLKDKLTGEASSQREAVSNLSQKLSKAEARANSMENEVHRVTLQLTEKGLLLDVLERDKDQKSARVKELESALQTEKEQASRAAARQEATQERLAQTQSEIMLLRQQLEEAQNKGVAKERAVTDAQERFSDILTKLRSDCEERVQLVEERNKELATKAADLRDQIYKLEEEKTERETNLRQLQQELADSLKKLSMSEASLEVNTRYRNDLEEEKTRILKDMERLKGKLEESEAQYVQAERRINSLKSTLDEREKELTNAEQKLQEALSASTAANITIKQLEEAVQRLEIENARLEAAAKQQSIKLESLQKGAQEAAMVRGHLEDLVTNLQSSKMTLEDQLSREVQKQSMLSHTAQDSQALWEEELKSRSKLGIRLAELEKEKGELNTQMEIEKKRAKKIAEQKKAVDSRLDQEMKRNTELQKEMYRLRTLLKTAKKKLREQDGGGAEFGSPMSSLRMDMSRHSQAEGAVGRMKEKVDDLQVQLEREASQRSQLEKINRELKDQLASLKSLSRSSEQAERSKRQLEEEVLELRRRMEATQIEQSQVEQYRRDAEEKARQEIQQKLEQVNLFLQSQAASQEALDQMKAANEANLRAQLEQKIRELEGELNRARSTQQDSLNQRESTRTELDRYRQLYAEELRLRKSLAAKLDRANSRLTEANSKLLNERSRSLITGSFANGSVGGPSLDVGSLGSLANYGATLGPPNRSLGLGFSLLSPVTDGQGSRVEDYLAKMQSELDRNISKELTNATAELDVASARMSPVGSATRVELNPLSRAKHQYLEVLKKNNMI